MATMNVFYSEQSNFPGAVFKEDIQVDIEQDALTCSFVSHMVDRQPVTNSFVITLDELRNRLDFNPPMIYALVAPDNSRFTLLNWCGETVATRVHIKDWGAIHRLSSRLTFSVPFADATFEDMHYSIRTINKQESVVTSNVPCVECDYASNANLRSALLPVVEITGPDTLEADGVAVFDIAASIALPSDFTEVVPFNQPLDVELVCTAGYLPKTRVPVVGTGHFRFRAADLEPGDTVKIKAGFRYWPAIASREVQII